MRISEERPLERLVGVNRGIVRQKLARLHVGRPIRELLRECRPLSMAAHAPALRRGWVLCVLETIREFRGTYVSVVAARPDYRAPLTWRD